METTWIYTHSEHSADHDLFTVGFYDPFGKFHSDSDHNDREKAAERVHWLNGGGNRAIRTSASEAGIFDGDL